MNGTNKAWAIIFATFSLTIFFVCTNTDVRQTDVVENVLMNPNNLSRQMYEKGQRIEGVNVNDGTSLVIPFASNIDFNKPVVDWNGEEVEQFAGFLSQVKNFSEAVSNNFTGFAIFGITEISNYKEVDGILLTDNFLHDWPVEQGQRRDYLQEFIKDVKQDPAVYGLLIGQNFDYARINIFSPPGSLDQGREKEIFWQIAEFLEQRQLNFWQRVLKYDIYPAIDKTISIASWVVGRSFIFQGLLISVISLTIGGFGFVFLIALLSLRSLKQTAITLTVITLSLVWMRGTIGLERFIGIEIAERVYILLVLTALIVQGISFCLHMFNAYNSARTNLLGYSSEMVWQSVVVGRVRYIIYKTAIIAILNFLSMYTIMLRSIAEVGFLSAIGTAYLVGLVIFFLPACHIIIGGESKPSSLKWLRPLENAWEKFLNLIIQRIIRAVNFSEQRAWHWPAWIALGQTVAVATLAIVLVVKGHLVVRTQPLDYITDTLVYQGSEFLNAPGRSGSEGLRVFVKPKNWTSQSEAIYAPKFIKRVKDYQTQLAGLPHAIITSSVLDTVSKISMINYQANLPQDDLQAYDVLYNQIETDLDAEQKEALWSDEGFMLFVWTSGEDANNLSELYRSIYQTAQVDFSEFDIIIPDRLQLYAESDAVMRTGIPLNEASSLTLIILICWIWSSRRNRKYRKEGVTCLLGFRSSLVIASPFVFGSSVMALFMMACGIYLDQAMACFFPLAVCAAIDFNLHTVNYFNERITSGCNIADAIRQTLEHKGPVVLMDVFANGLCFSLLIASGFYPIKMLGIVLVIMMFFTGYASLVNSMAMLPWCVKKNETERTKS